MRPKGTNQCHYCTTIIKHLRRAQLEWIMFDIQSLTMRTAKKKCNDNNLYIADTDWSSTTFGTMLPFFSMHFVQLGGWVAAWPSIAIFLFMCSWTFISSFSHIVSLWILSLGSTNFSLPVDKHKLLFVNQTNFSIILKVDLIFILLPKTKLLTWHYSATQRVFDSKS